MSESEQESGTKHFSAANQQTHLVEPDLTSLCIRTLCSLPMLSKDQARLAQW